MDRLEAMRTLVNVIDRGSFSSASKAMNVPLATVSRKISDLEKLLGTRLLTRTTRKLTLTDAGSQYLDKARTILELVDCAEHEAQGEYLAPKGHLVLTAPLLFGRRYLQPLVTEFLAMYPDIQIQLHLSDQNVDLIDEHIDMALRVGHLPDSNLVATQVGTMPFITCVSPELLAETGPVNHPSDLSHQPCVTLDTRLPFPVWQFCAPDTGQMFEVPISPRFRVNSGQAVVDAAVAQIGFARVLYYQAFPALKVGSLVSVLNEYEREPVPIHMMHVARGRMPLKLLCFLDFAIPRMRTELAEMMTFRQPAE
ncbi:LysR substrate-binding domain-containing protein [Reinekea blandensis]|uniref:Transcriptional regulator, GstR n=1 Tax=Reinekea blandensis MED297 TaxID=314283 RepID=A4BB32_9GAMM|nr:LysR substrate-binding domain-containing protein [Reinekea blandensis]EAR10645.1 transcriptional regulator, GstR [Reinekea sp. MED297] [Reinekea blandensis MED297]